MTVKLNVGDKVRLLRGATSEYEKEFPNVVDDFLKFKGWSWEQDYVIQEFVEGDVGVFPVEGGKPGVVYVMHEYLVPVTEAESEAEPEKEDTSEHLVPVWKLKEAMVFLGMGWEEIGMDKAVKLANRLK